MKKRILTALLSLSLLLLALTPFLSGCAAQGQSSSVTTLYVYNWGEYLSDGSEGTDNVNDMFEEWYFETFGERVEVNYSTYSDLSNRLEKTEQGYYLHLDTLPDFSDLTFTLSKSEDPEVKPNVGLISFLTILIVGIFMQNVVLPIVLAIMIIVFLIKLPRIIRRRKEKRKAKQEEAQETESSEQPTDEDA